MAIDLKQTLEKEYSLGLCNDLVRLKSGVSNENYRALMQSGDYIVRICHFEPQNQINVMLPFLEYAQTIEYPAPRLVKTIHGAGYYGSETEPIIVTTVIPGEAGTDSTINTNKLLSLGLALARLHGLDWIPDKPSKTTNTSYILDVYSQFSNAIPAPTKDTDEFLRSLAEDFEYFSLADVQAQLNALPIGLIHNDVIPGNVLFANDTVTSFVDLEEISQGVMLLDIARVITMWCFNERGVDRSRIGAFLASYNNSRPLTNDEKELLPLVIRFVCFRNCVYGMKMLAQNRITSVSDIKEYDNLKFAKNNKLELKAFTVSATN